MLKTVSSVVNAIGALNYKGTWNASTNDPTLVSSVGTKGDYYVVSTAGSTNLNGETLWGVGDWAVFNGLIWQKVDGGDTSTVNSLTVTSLTGYMYANNSAAVNASTTIPVAAVSGAVPNTVYVIAGTGLTGGGALAGNITLNATNTNSGTVTQVQGNGTVNGITLTGNVTTTGNITLGGSLSNIPNTAISNANITIGNTTIGLGNTATSLGNLTLANVTIVSGRENLTSSNIAYSGANSNLGSLSVGGPLSSSDIGIISSFVGNASTYSYIAVQNTNNSNTSYASVSTINNGFSAYSDLGTNSTTYDYVAAGFPNNPVSAANASFLLSYSGNLAIGTWNSNTVHFLANASSATTSAMSVNPNNTVTIASLISSNVLITGGAINVTTTNMTANVTANATFATSSLPLVPAGYIVTDLNGTLVKVPYYAV